MAKDVTSGYLKQPKNKTYCRVEGSVKVNGGCGFFAQVCFCAGFLPLKAGLSVLFFVMPVSGCFFGLGLGLGSGYGVKRLEKV